MKHKFQPKLSSNRDQQDAFRQRAMRAANKADKSPYVLREGNQVALVTGLVREKDRLKGQVNLYTLSSASFARRLTDVLQAVALQSTGTASPDDMMRAAITLIEKADAPQTGNAA